MHLKRDSIILHIGQIVLLSIIILPILTTCDKYSDDFKLTQRQAKALNQIKAKLGDKIPDYFGKSDLNLLRFIRAKNFDVDKSVQYILSELEWRNSMKFKTIHQEDWSDMERDISMSVDGYDKKGLPHVYQEMGEWDVRSIILQGKRERFQRWVFKKWDEARIKVDEQAAMGKNVSRWNYLVDLKGMSVTTNLSPASMLAYTPLITGFLSHFPNQQGEIYCVNTPAVFEVFLSLVRNLAPPLRDLMQVYGHDEKEWKPVLRNLVDPSSLKRRYGGEKGD